MSRIGPPAPKLPKQPSTRREEPRKVWFDEAAELRRRLALWCHWTERDFEDARRRGLGRPDGQR